MVISELSLVELSSVLRRKVAEGVIDEEELLAVLNFFRRDIVDFTILRFDSGIVNSAVNTVIKHGLKTLDGLQLAFALRVKEHNPIMVSFDKELNRAAEKEGFRLFEPGK